MPAKANSNKSAKRSAKRQPKRPQMFGVTTRPLIFPSRMKGTMTYDESGNLGPAVGTTSVLVFRGNSVYDPDFTGTGTTCRGYSQMASLYGRYRVLGFRASITWNNLTTSPCQIFAVLSPTTTIGTDFYAMVAQRHIWRSAISQSTGSGHAEHKLGSRVSAIYGVPESQVLTEDDFAAVTGANPNNGVYLHVGVYSDYGTASVNVNIRMEYDVVWSLPLEIST